MHWLRRKYVQCWWSHPRVICTIYINDLEYTKLFTKLTVNIFFDDYLIVMEEDLGSCFGSFKLEKGNKKESQ